jgi:hypothetical protein
MRQLIALLRPRSQWMEGLTHAESEVQAGRLQQLTDRLSASFVFDYHGEFEYGVMDYLRNLDYRWERPRFCPKEARL